MLKFRQVALWLGPVLALIVAALCSFNELGAPIAWTAGLTVLCATWWIFEPIPIPATSMLPIAVLPLVGVLTPNQVGAAYGSPLILLLLGGFILSTAMARSGVHRRLALGMASQFGGYAGPSLVLGFMVAAAVLSMWISNTATALMLLPIALAVCERVKSHRFQLALLLGIAYACSVGGIGTPVGTPPNLIFMRVYQETTGNEITFLQWMIWALPVVIVLVPAMAWWLSRGLERGQRVELPEPGAWRAEEVRTLVVFGVTAVLWVTRKEPFGGWSELLDLPSANDASVALLAVVAMFLIPNGKGERLLNWETAVTIPWGILILFAAGVTLAEAFTASGLSDLVGGLLAQLSTLPVLVILLGLCLGVTFLTEVTSNTATTALLMPILAAAALAGGTDPLLMMVPAAMSASCAFMLPVATGPNAVVFGSGEVKVEEMARKGFAINLIGAVLISLVAFFYFGR